jgi:polyhydroxyalkanoate synthesis regulator phasin
MTDLSVLYATADELKAKVVALDERVRRLELWANRTPLDAPEAEEDGGEIGRLRRQVKVLEEALRLEQRKHP